MFIFTPSQLFTGVHIRERNHEKTNRRCDKNNVQHLRTSVEVVAKLEQKEVIASRHVLIADGIARVPGDAWASFENESGREIAGGVSAGEPIGSERDCFVQWLLEGKLTARTVRTGNGILREVVTAESDPRAVLKRLACFCVEVVSGVVGAIAYRNEKIVANHDVPAVF